jgi:hypothetical protein
MENSKRARAVLFLIASILAAAMLTNSVSFLNNPAITPTSESRPDTTDALTCSWNKSADTTDVNVTWMNGSTPILTYNDVSGSSVILSADYTARGDNWYCNVTLGNSTAMTSSWVNVTIKNAPPTTPNMTNNSGQTIGNLTAAFEDVVNNYTLFSIDPDDDSITYGYIGGLPANAVFDYGTGEFWFTPQQFANTDTNVTFYATDNYGTNPGITSKKVQFNVVYRNDPPSFSPALTYHNISEGEVLNYHVSAIDEESNYPLNFTVASVPNLTLTLFQTDDTTATIMFENNATASYYSGGNYTVSVVVRDSLNATTNASFWLQIFTVNLAPQILNHSNLSGIQGQAFSTLFEAYDPDANQTLNFTISTVNCTYGNIWNSIETNITYNLTSTNATGNLTISNLTNNYVVCRNLRLIVVDDKGAEDSEDVFLNITNTNDPPIVQVLSFHYNNTKSQTNLTNLTAYANAKFRYLVNATDIDKLTYAGDNLTYTEDTLLFAIDSATGQIDFTPVSGDVGSYTINVTATDLMGANDTAQMNLTIITNSPPVLAPVGDIICFEDVLCYVEVNASDPDGDNLTFASSNSVFPLTNNLSTPIITSAYVSYTPLQDHIGVYPINVSVTDDKGSTRSENINFTINNTNDPPQLTDFAFPDGFENHTVAFNIYAADDDYSLPNSYEWVTFSVQNLSGKLLFNITTQYLNGTNRSYGQIVFLPQIGDAGNYTYMFTATDFYGVNSSRNKTITIKPKSDPPVILNIRPIHGAFDNTVLDIWGNASDYPGEIPLIVNENRTVTFDVNATDDDTPVLNYTWFINGAQVSINKTLIYNFDFFSSGRRDFKIVVNDSSLEYTQFSWNMTINNINRAPRIINPLINLTGNNSVNGTTGYYNYLLKYNGPHMVDPDDDLNSNNEIDGAETNSLTYTVTTCAVADITIQGSNIVVKPFLQGVCNVKFIATDSGGLSLESNTVYINASQITNDTTVVETPLPTSGGGGQSRVSPLPIPIVKQDIKPQAIKIVMPELITVYDNQSLKIPVIIQNTWNTSLKGVKLNATSLSKEVGLSLSEYYFEEMSKNERINITLTVQNYRLGADYKIEVSANVSDPRTGDSASIFLNSIEKSKTGKDVQTKVTFAQDLLNQNPECLELNELLVKAKADFENGVNPEEAAQIVDGVIEGCKYLVSVSKKSEQRPQTVFEKVLAKEYRPYLIIFLAIAAFTAIAIIGVKWAKKRETKNKESSEKTEAGDNQKVKPYWPNS